MIRLENIELRRGSKPLLLDSSVTVHPGQRVGLVGTNGCGKSSLFALLRGEIDVDSGSVSLPAAWRISAVAQETPAVDKTVLEYTIDVDAEYRRLQQEIAAAEASQSGEQLAQLIHDYDMCDGYSMEARAGRLLHGLGFSVDEQQRTVASFSGGWRMRINLARALLCPSELLLLDEPTNHLDLDAIYWLEKWLKSYAGTLLLISHDREFLDRAVDAVVHIEHQTLFYYAGNYSGFEQQRAGRLAQQQALFEKQEKQRAHLQKYIDRFRYKASKARQAQSRIKALEKLQATAALVAASGFNFRFAEPEALSSPLISLDNVMAGYGEKTVLERIAMNLQPGVRIGLLGRNGAGKSTLIKLLAGLLQPQSGHLTQGGNLAIGYFAQHQLEALDIEATPLLHLQRLAPKASEQALRNYLGGFGFRGDTVLAPVAPFSGGEKARLALALVVWQKPNLLLLDEPTNHLDLDMREALVFAIQAFKGAVVLVSHDRHLLSTVVDEFYLVRGGKVAPFDGDLEDYHKILLTAESDVSTSLEDQSLAQVMPRKEKKRLEAVFRESIQPLKKQLGQIETQMERWQQQLADLDQKLSDPELYGQDSSTQMTSLMKEQGNLRTSLQSQEALWFELQDEIEVRTEAFTKKMGASQN